MSQLPEQKSVLCVGRFYCDLIFTDVPRLPTFGTEVFAGGFGVHAGGGAFITAAHLVSLGHRVAMSAMLPTTPFAEAVQPELDTAGIDLSLCGHLPKGVDPQVTVALAGGGDRAFVTRRSGPAFPQISATDIAQLGVQHLHIGELATLLELPGIVGMARQAGLTISLDCGWDDALSANQIAEVLPGVDVFLPNSEEMDHLRELGVPEPFSPCTIIKQGAGGATGYFGGSVFSDQEEVIAAVDTTGAGDAFNAGFLSAWLSGQTPSECLRAGNRQGSRAITRRGGFCRDDPAKRVAKG